MAKTHIIQQGLKKVY